jgi:Helix-turn-helix
MKYSELENYRRGIDYALLRQKVVSRPGVSSGFETQEMLAKKLGVDVRTVQRRENAEITVTDEALLALRYVVEKSEQANKEFYALSLEERKEFDKQWVAREFAPPLQGGRPMKRQP